MLFELAARTGRLLLGVVVLYVLWLCCWLWIHIEAFAFRIYSKDTKKDKREATLPTDRNNVRSVRLVFIRHGESTWNETFNRSKAPHKFGPRLLYAAAYETSLLMAGSRDSWFLDSPLSHKGLEDAELLQEFLRKTAADDADPLSDDCKEILGTHPHVSSTVTVSNLRRAVTTCIVGLWDRLSGPDQRAIIHSDLQEISKNPDTLAITPAGQTVEPSWLDKAHTKTNFASRMKTILDPVCNMGSKPMGSRGQQRLHDFAKWAADGDRGTVICVGHSFWFREFCREFLPKKSTHDIKTYKIHNCGVMALTMLVDESGGSPAYSVDPESIKTIYLGLAKK